MGLRHIVLESYNREIIPPSINWNSPNKLDALPLPPVRSSIAIENQVAQ